MSDNQNKPSSGLSLKPQVFIIIGVILAILVVVLLLVTRKGEDKPLPLVSQVPVMEPSPSPLPVEPSPSPVVIEEAVTTPASDWTVARLEEVIKNNSPIYFVKDSSRLKKGELAKVEAIAEALSHFKNIHLFFKGHTAAHNKVAFRYALSRARADRVRWALEYRVGYDITSVTVKGYGSTRLLVKGDSEEQRAPNRRVEIILQNAEPK